MNCCGKLHRILGRCWLAASLVLASGCLRFLHPIPSLRPDVLEPCRAADPSCREHVYVFLIQGVDPFDLCNLRGVGDYIQELGFAHTHFGQLYHVFQFDREIHRIHQCDPDARFVLIGFSCGANIACYLAHNAAKDGITINLLVYLGGNTLENTPHDRPENAARVVNILASGCIWNGTWFDDALNVHETDVWHFGSPTHPATLEILASELAKLERAGARQSGER
jgi:hypothetical protein